jgi:PAS domain S-box-containing protein
VLKNRDLKRKVLINTIAAAVYFALAVLTSPASSNLSQNSLSNRLLICPVSGLEIAASILIGPYLWPGISLAALGAAVFKGFSLPGALLAAAAHGLGVTLSALAVRRWIKSSNPFQNMRSVLIYTILVVFLISALMSGLRAASISLSLNLWSQFLPLYASLWISTIAGFLVLTPFVLVWADRSNLPDWDIVRISRLAVNLTVLGLITWATFSAEIILPSSDHLHLGLVIIPLVILTASLFGLHGAVSATLTVALISTLFDLQGVHLFAASQPHFSTLFLQGYQSVIAVTGLLSAAALVERDRALQKSRQMHATQQAFLKNTGVWLSLSDAAGRITAWSKGAEEISGYSSEEVLDKELIWPLLHTGQPEKDHFRREMQLGMKDHARLENVEMSIQTKSGEMRLLSWNIDTLKDTNDTSLGTIVVGLDITNQNQTEEALRQERDQAEALVKAAAVIGGSLELEEVIQRVLSQALSVIPCDGVNIIMPEGDTARVVYKFGYEDAEIADMISRTQFPREMFENIIAKLERGERNLIADTRLAEDWIITPTTNWVRSYISVPIKIRGEVLGLLNLDSSQPNTFNEMHARTLQTFGTLLANTLENAQRYGAVQTHAIELEKRINERTLELRAANLEMQRALQAKDEFLANMSHELRTPLTAILGLSELLDSEVRGPLNEIQKKYTRTITDSGQQLLVLVNDILDLARIESEKMELYIETIHIHEACESSISRIRAAAQQKNLEILYDFDQQQAVMQVDALRLRQVLFILLNNAVKFTDDGGRIGLEVDYQPQSGVVRFTVWDTGIGIPPDQAKLLFQPFVQLDASLARKFEGAGLGLSLAARLIQMHGGSIALESTGLPGEGTRMCVALPLSQILDILPPAPPPLSGTVLLIEDHPTCVQHISQALKASGLTVYAAKCGEEAADLDRNGYPDLVILHLQTCKNEGWTILEKLHTWFSPCSPPVLIISSISLPGDEQRAAIAGARAYLNKPVDPVHLTKLVDSFLKNDEIDG